mmetsp:Transcript_103246/g.321130  ORF Transcript_103246/g.321130 Transcript_103246/m.321130 type:complete len:215 (+) Transcript_103246:764-1408(+)
MNWGHWPVTRVSRCSSMSQARKTASFLFTSGTEGWMSCCTSGRQSGRPSATKMSGWCCMRAPMTSQHAICRAGSSSSSSPSASSSSSGAFGFAALFSASTRLKDAARAFMAIWPMCRTCWAERMPGPALFRQVFTPSARVLRASASSDPSASSLGRMRLRNSCTSCVSTSGWPPSLAARQSSPQVSKARSRISSAMEKSKTGSSAWAVCATKGA